MHRLLRMFGWVAPPRPESRALTAQVALLHAILLVLMLGGGLCAAVFPFVYERWREAFFVNLTIGLVPIPLLVALRRGHVEVVGRITAWIGAFSVVLSIVNSGGIRSPAILAFPAALMVAGFVARVRGLVAVTVMLVAVLLVVGIGEDKGFLRGASVPFTGLELFLSFAASLTATAAVIHFSLRTIRVALESAEESESRLAGLIDGNPDGILLTDLDGDVRSTNRAARALLALGEDEVVSLFALSALSRDSGDRLRSEILAASDGETHETMLELTAGDSHVYARARILRVKLPDQTPGCQITLRDETARVTAENQRAKLEEALVQGQKMQVVGQLAGGVAHDFNNYLSVIRTCADTLRAKLPSDGKTAPLLDAIAEASERSSELTRQLLAFSRKQVMQPRLVELGEVVGATLPMLRRTLPPRISLRVSNSSARTTVFADPSQLEVAILNLVVNARDAMPNGGEIFIDTDVVAFDDDTSRRPGFESGCAVVLDVRDTGDGMDAATLARAREPFFTTKGTSGTGLGLSSVDGIVEQSGGVLRLESGPGVGTRARILLPVATGESSRVREPAQEPARGGTETILLVEDQPLLRSVAEDMLIGAGYRVLVAEDAEKAFELFEASEDDIALVISDVVLPGADGVDLAGRLRARRPRLAILLVSGFMPSRPGGEAMPFPFLQKPFAARTLLHRARELLDVRNVAE